MKAVIIATNYSDSDSNIKLRCLDNFIDRSFIQHVIEHLIKNEIHNIDIILNEQASEIEGLFGDGTRWGCSFNYHLCLDSKSPYKSLKIISKNNSDEHLLVVHANELPSFEVYRKCVAKLTSRPLMFVYTDGHKSKWSGCSILEDGFITKLPNDLNYKGLEKLLFQQAYQNAPYDLSILIPAPLDVKSEFALLESQKRVFENNRGTFNLLLSGIEGNNGVTVGRNTYIDPDAKLIAPVFIGCNCRVEKGCVIGPCVSIGENSIVDSKTELKNSSVNPYSYVGRSLNIENSIVSHNVIKNALWNSKCEITDAFILNSLSFGKIKIHASDFVTRLVGLFLLVLSLPVLVLVASYLKWVKRADAIHIKKAVSLPCNMNQVDANIVNLYSFEDWSLSETYMGHKSNVILRYLILKFMPSLINIVKGDIKFMGLPAQTKEELLELNEERRDSYLSSKIGVFQPHDISQSILNDKHEKQIAEMYYIKKTGFWYDWLSFIKFVTQYAKSNIYFKVQKL